MLSLAGFLTAQTDPGPRSGAPGAGAAIPGLTVKEGKFFHSGQAQFTEVQSVTGTIAGTEEGLGPRFNLNSCSGCHAFPAIGGAGPASNPQGILAPSLPVHALLALYIISAPRAGRVVR